MPDFLSYNAFNRDTVFAFFIFSFFTNYFRLLNCPFWWNRNRNNFGFNFVPSIFLSSFDFAIEYQLQILWVISFLLWRKVQVVHENKIHIVKNSIYRLSRKDIQKKIFSSFCFYSLLVTLTRPRIVSTAIRRFEKKNV